MQVTAGLVMGRPAEVDVRVEERWTEECLVIVEGWKEEEEVARRLVISWGVRREWM